ncbi:MAG: sugar ABC transporter ATP-binding protein [Desulfotomaculaceae bacterium]|nr:sugar ABC transporter ATP-binding protein [Desulfotomaculaceae bacterium]
MDHQNLDAVAAAYPDPIALKLQDISKIYPGTVALHKVNIDVKKGEVHGIIGKNGAGKSTLVEIIAGITTPTGGRIFIGGKSYDSFSRIDARKKKIAIVPQEPQLILDFTVAENLFISDYTRKGRLINWPELYAKAEQVVKKAALHINVRIKAGDLPISEQQLLLILKACYVDESDIIILDEASASLSQKDEELLYSIIQERKSEGSTILFISHRAEELLKVCDRVTVLRDGRSIITKNCSELDKDKLSDLIVGEEFCSDIKADTAQLKDMSEIVLSVENLTRLGVYHKITFKLKKGEILGLAGLRGSGRTEIFKGIIGIDHPDEGAIYVNGQKRRFASPAEALKDGIVYLPEDREKEGLVNNLSVRENLILNSLNNVKKGLLINRNKEKKAVANLIKGLDIKVASSEQEVSQLSGGNKQKVVVGKIAAARPHVFLLDEPTKGVDISAKQGILNIVKNNLSRDAGVIITSPGLEDLINICDRILIIYKGRITGEFWRGELKESDLFLAVQGVAQNKCS